MMKHCAYIASLILGVLCMAAIVICDAAYGAEISAPAGPSTIVIKTCDHDAGAICSLTWNGRQFIDDHDHGRQLQSAVSFDKLGEAFNPTEAGASSATDGFNPHPSTSQLLYQLASGSALTTQTQMAFWKPVYGERLSGHILTKRVNIGLPGLPNVIEYLTEFEIPTGEAHWFGQFEVLTGYMPSAFSMFWALDVRGGQVSPVPISDGPGEQPFPVIMSTPNGSHAMGIYSPDTPQPEYAEAGYGRWRFVADKVVKWNQVARITNPVGTYRFRSYVIVGSLEEVAAQMVKLHARVELHLREKIICTKRP